MPAITVPSELSAYSDAITTLTNATLYGCYTLTLQGSLLMSNFAASSGGGVFSSHETGLIIDGCDAYSNRSAGGRGNATASASGQAASMPVVPRVGHGGGLASLAACGEMAAVEGVEMRRVLLQAAGLGNSVGNGYGADIATLPTTVAILRAGVLAVEDGAQNETKTSTDYVPPKNPLPPIRFSGNTLVLPSTSPVTVATVPMRLTDALGQDVRDPLLGSVISILAGSNVTDYVTMVLVGDNVAEYNTTDGTFIFQGLGVRGVVGQNYILTFNVTSSMAGGNQIPLLEQLIQVWGVDVDGSVGECGERRTIQN
ncbi:hypothetical protein FOA52_008173 [Chlamydomonas sp. UWO 241]|nr:hypothetical protein FOA52_008173 [Chlamydomonas sp. UWO 241]